MGKNVATSKSSSKTTSAPKPSAPATNPLSDWRDATLSHIRTLIQQADPDAVEEVKWRKPTKPEGVPTWSHGGLICTGETYKDKVKVTFAKGAELEDPSGLFNSSLEGNARRAIDFSEGDKIDVKAFKALIQAAVALNTKSKAATRPTRSAKKAKKGG